MKTYNVYLTAESFVSSSVQVDAGSEEEARTLALKMAQEGNVSWSYDGVQEGTEETTAVTEG